MPSVPSTLAPLQYIPFADRRSPANVESNRCQPARPDSRTHTPFSLQLISSCHGSTPSELPGRRKAQPSLLSHPSLPIRRQLASPCTKAAVQEPSREGDEGLLGATDSSSGGHPAPPPASGTPQRGEEKREHKAGAEGRLSNGSKGEKAWRGVGREGVKELLFENTLSGRKEALRPMEEGHVGMYVCGVTVYDFSHIGHARVYVAFDALFRFLRALGYDVTYVRNFTDVDDKILRRARETGQDPLALSARFIREFHADMEQLRCLPPTHEPKVSDHIPDIIHMISTIIERGHGYAVEGGDVFFSVPSCQGYGQLSGRRQDENRAGERVEVDPRKRSPADFALWKSAKEGEGVAWASPWGRGRPGWHIECSAMSARYLGFRFDIHGGGQDLVFPHHENELAQSRAACVDCHVSLWLHNGFVNIDSEKMSKSTGNFFTIRQALEQYHPLALRWFLLSTHYRSPINYSQRQLAQASDRLFYVYQLLSNAHAVLASEAPPASQQTPPYGSAGGSVELPAAGEAGRHAPKPKKAAKAAEKAAATLSASAWSALADDFHTALALAALSEPFRILSDLVAPKKAAPDAASAGVLLSPITEILDLLGFPTQPQECNQVLMELRQLTLTRAGLSEAALETRMQERLQARQAKDFALSDRIRDELAQRGILLMDGKGVGQLWCPSATTALGLDKEGGRTQDQGLVSEEPKEVGGRVLAEKVAPTASSVSRE